MTGYGSTNGPSQGQPDWVVAMSRNPSFFDPRTTFVPSLVTIPEPSRKARNVPRSVPFYTELSPSSLPAASPRLPVASTAKWGQDNLASSSQGSNSSRVNNAGMLQISGDDDDCPDEWLLKEPLALEHTPPYPQQKATPTTDTLYGLHSQLRQDVVIPMGPKPEVASTPVQVRAPKSSQTYSSGLFEEASYPSYIGAESFSPDPIHHNLSDLTCSSSGLSVSLMKGVKAGASGPEKIATPARCVGKRVWNWVLKLGF